MEQSRSGAPEESQRGRGLRPGAPPTSPESVRRPEAGTSASSRRPASEQASPKRKGEEASRGRRGEAGSGEPADAGRARPQGTRLSAPAPQGLSRAACGHLAHRLSTDEAAQEPPLVCSRLPSARGGGVHR
ncbi:hypothetical protein Emag_001394 [Eimeria magna]